MVIRRGQVWFVDFGTPRGSSPGYQHPAVVIQADDFNETEVRSVVVASVTTNLRLAEMPGNVLIASRASGLEKRSVVNVTQIFTMDRLDLVEQIGTLSTTEVHEIDKGLRLVLSL